MRIACSYLDIAAFLRLLSLYGILIATCVFAHQGVCKLSPRCGVHLMGSEPVGDDHWDGAIDNIERILERDRW